MTHTVKYYENEMYSENHAIFVEMAFVYKIAQSKQA